MFCEWGLSVGLGEEGPFVKCSSLFIKVFPTVVRILNAAQWPRNARIGMEGEWQIRGKELASAYRNAMRKSFFFVFVFSLSKLPVLCPSLPADFEFCGGARGVKVTGIKESFVPISQSHRSPLAADLEHDTAISWCHT